MPTARPAVSLLGLLIGLVACQETKPGGGSAGVDTAALSSDADGDGHPSSEDCNDSDAAVSPSATELCDGIDNDCDGEVDEGVMVAGFEDADGDGFGDELRPVEACELGTAAVTNANDCDDADGAVFPGATEVCNGIDDNCDGAVDEGVTLTVYDDLDGDGYGDTDSATERCAPEEGEVEVDGDCDDDDASAFPGGVEVCDEQDNDCDGETDEGVTTTYYVDVDDDGYGGLAGTTEACSAPEGYAELTGDCDDGDPAYHPGALEDDCTDPNDYNCDGSVAYADADADGWAACEECDDSRADVNPDAAEICNSIDDDCDGDIDDADADVDLSTGTTFYEDADSDGYGAAGSTLAACALPTGYVADNTDCDDTTASVSPGATEVCDSVDNNCDGTVDDDDPLLDTATGSPFYSDSDGDGYGDASAVTMACSEPSGTVSNSSDCDDSMAAVNPAATELCDGIDNDCDADIDDADADVTGQATWYLDVDGDGYGGSAASTDACTQPSGYTAAATDCNDGNSAINPGASEVCNSVDDDCDGLTDDADSSVDLSTGSTYYYDADGDGYGLSSVTTASCAVPTGYATTGSDCNDSNSAVNPGATEVCDAADNDCDSLGDEGLTCSYKLVQSDLSSGLCVDDDVYVNKNGSRIYTDTTWGAQCGHVVNFTATPGDSLQIWAVDSVGGCRTLSAVYIVEKNSGKGKKLANGYSQTCSHGASSSPFYNVTVSVPGAF
jgi:hypothetical protein